MYFKSKWPIWKKNVLCDAISVMNRGEERRRNGFEGERLPSWRGVMGREV